MEKLLRELVERLQQAVGPNLQSVILYGSAAAGEYQPGFSDLNILCVVENLDLEALEQLSPVIAWWTKTGQPAPLVFPREELLRSADVFAIEMLDIRAAHRVLHGENLFATLQVPMHLHRIEVERELRLQLLRLRQRYLATPQNKKALLDLLAASISSTLTLFRHALLALGEPSAASRRAALEQLSRLLGFDPAAFHALLDLREGKRRVAELDPVALLRGYLGGLARVADEVDRRLG
ncbi:MAG: nucleotidyltransferase domain-containing protein [Acidobacteriia bacterium]|jgi:predicted nucleotidyltransferase|nr:nucleotidyltransferase domain-containing protein [Terriglobia bacterium]